VPAAGSPLTSPQAGGGGDGIGHANFWTLSLLESTTKTFPPPSTATPIGLAN
jgi:hypothetical protein